MLVSRPPWWQIEWTDNMSKRGAVLLVANYPSDVGYAWWLMENFWALIAQEMHRQGRTCLLAYPKVNRVPKQIEQAPLQVLEIDIRPRSLLAALRGGIFLRRHGVGSVYLTDWPGLSWVYLLWRLTGVRTIVLHDHTPGDRPLVRGPRGWLKSLLHRLSVLSCTTYVGVSEYVQRRFSENWRVPPRRCLCVRNGITPFHCEVDDREAVRRSVGVPAGAVMVVLVSRATRYKGWDFAIECLARIHAAGSCDLHFVFCGDGPNLQEFRQLAQQRGVAERAHFLGRRSDVRNILCAADFAFHPSRGEALSLATLEFMCSGLPVVVPDRPSVCAVIEHEVSGLIYKAEDTSAAVAALTALASDPARRATLGLQARQIALADYTLERTNERFRSAVVALL